MIKFIRLSILCLLTFSTLELSAAPTSSEQAMRVVENWRAQIVKPLGSDIPSEIEGVETYHDDDSNVLYHIVSMDPEGFVIVAGDDQVEPIIAFLPLGHYDITDVNNPLIDFIHSDLTDRVESARSNAKLSRSRSFDGSLTQSQADKDAQIAQNKWDRLDVEPSHARRGSGMGTIADVRVAPFLATKWSQKGIGNSGSTYNRYTPNNWWAGCTATAFAQVLRYFEHDAVPSSIRNWYYVDGVGKYATILGGDGNGGAYNWSLMPDGPTIDDQDSAVAVGRLLFDAGITVHMRYTAGSGSAWIYDAATALTNRFGYSNARIARTAWKLIKQPFRDTILNTNLDAKLPMIWDIGGHSVNCDGYGYDSNSLYYHINMGYGGYTNMWYTLPVSDQFSRLREVLYNVYATGTGEIISGRVTDNNGQALAGATLMAQRDGGGSYSATSDDKGVYAFVKIPSNSTYTLSVAKNGYIFPTQQAQTLKSGAINAHLDDPEVGNKWGVDFQGTPGTPSNIPPTSDAGGNRTVIVNNSISITGSGSDSDGTITGYRWTDGTSVLSTSETCTYTPTSTGTKTLTFIVIDDDGATDSDTMIVTVSADIPTPQNNNFSIIPILLFLMD